LQKSKFVDNYMEIIDGTCLPVVAAVTLAHKFTESQGWCGVRTGLGSAKTYIKLNSGRIPDFGVWL